ncbi:MAG: IS701 family transposase [Acidobacteriota bacterium]
MRPTTRPCRYRRLWFPTGRSGPRPPHTASGAALRPSRCALAKCPTHQSLHHVVAVAPWNDQLLLQAVRQYVLPQMTGRAPMAAWVVDDTGLPKKDKHSVGVARQSCGPIGKQDNCQVAVSLSVSTNAASLPVAYELYPPETCSEDPERRRKAGVPDEVVFRTKPLIAAEPMQRAVVDAAYGNDTKLRKAPLNMGAGYGTGIRGGHSADAVHMACGTGTPAAEASPARASPPTGSRPGSCVGSPPTAWKMIFWRKGTKNKLESRFAAVRARPANRDFERREPLPEQGLLIEWPPNEWHKNEAQPTKYWWGNLAADTSVTTPSGDGQAPMDHRA